MTKQTIAVDLDDVLASSAADFVLYSNKKWGTNLTPEDYQEHWAEMWEIDIEEAERRAHHIYYESKIQGRVTPLDAAAPVLRRLSANYDLVITTARPKFIEQITREWIEMHHQGIFQNIHFAGIWGEGYHPEDALNLTKADLLERVGADYLIDDHPKHCTGALKKGVKPLLFGDYAWNRNVQLPEGIVRVKDWAAVQEFFDAKAKR